MPAPEVEPAARSRASTDAVYVSGTSTGIQPGSRDHGSRKPAAVRSSSSTLASTAGPDLTAVGSARLASARTATTANGATRAHSPGPWNGAPAFSP